MCDSRALECPDGIAESFVARYHRSTGNRMRRCHPGDVVFHAVDLMNFEGLPLHLDETVLDRAFRRCFTEVAGMEA